MLTRVGFAFDDEYERRKSQQQSVRFDDLLASKQVQQRVLEWREFMNRFEVYDSIEKLPDVLHRWGCTGTTPIRLWTPRSASMPCCAAPPWTPGGLLVAVAQVGRDVPRGRALPTPCWPRFSSVGVNGKLADDVIDFRPDLLAWPPESPAGPGP